ncbi:site-specific integrase [Microvirga sp. KLBC 81]|uniref:tyrosine-type recombinase/integrase n=1 Tax=Microvirga sp. KLBC 81 TaxID=1862707 RepID=UPI000D513036|nr:site-specific integrase [Microvirga sp. KLBC 81]PVE22850.1 site-specific integrase [Microvirga sp. KLBC 81]
MASIRKRTLPSGKTVWLAAYLDGAGKRRFKQFARKAEADAFLVTVRSQVAAGVHTPDSVSITVKEAADLWLERCERDKLEETTLRQYRAHVNLHIVPRIGATKLSRLTTPAVNAFADQLIADGRSADMAKRVLRSLSAIVAEAKRRGLAAMNHVRDATPIKRSKRGEARPEMPSKAELKAMIDAAQDRERPFLFTAIFTGLRASELRGLKWKDIDLKKGILHVRRRVDRFNQFGPPKSAAGTRDIPLTPILLKTLKEWRLACPNGELELVFPTGAGNVESHGNILSRLFWPLQIRAGVVNMVDRKDAEGRDVKMPDAKYSLHALRHAAAALWIEQGLSPKRIQSLMGHSSIQQTFDTYGYLFEARDDDKAAMAAVEIGLLS